MPSKVVKYGKGAGSVEITGTDRDMYLEIIREADPIVVKVLEDATDKLAADSEKNWLIRQPKYGKSKGSKYKHRTGIRIRPPYTIEAFVENTAEYAWAIKVGSTSTTNLREGQRLADVVLWTPAKDSVDGILKRIAELTIKKIRGM